MRSYPEGYDRDEKHPYLALLSTFIKLKQPSVVDPFQDPKGSPEKDLPAGLLFECEDLNSQKRRAQIGACATPISGSQFYVHAFSVFVSGPTARFIVWDRGGAVVSEQFNYVNEPQHLLSFFYRYSRISSEDQGIDATTMKAMNREAHAILSNIRRAEMNQANKDGKESCKGTLTDCDDAVKQDEFLVSYPFSTPSPFSRPNRSMLAFDLTGKLVHIRDYWMPDVDNVEKEGKFYKASRTVPFELGNHVTGHKIVTRAPNDERPKRNFPAPQQMRMSHYRMTLNTVGKALQIFESSREYISAIADAMEG